MELLLGNVPTPPAARPLYDALQRCHVYATGTTTTVPRLPPSTTTTNDYNQHSDSAEYGDYPSSYPPEATSMPPPPNDQHSYAGMSDVTSDPGY
jgi:hypothetical protein